jgi:hypothetical protein
MYLSNFAFLSLPDSLSRLLRIGCPRLPVVDLAKLKQASFEEILNIPQPKIVRALPAMIL